ncbi:hypothetical protein PI95_008255 [Hassallia byssoidea VB512170]|uniref:Uncharacterized protein n=1 Tax=Hassallia byssoidea VB512170 TaxID=1304833 RepID=A0A846H7Q9_9CYAN|nr:hypothetical protein [Hassalia byssoidea]NEU72561.1 hypothetical protein [Hassalia byssoidea VB512170]
MGWFDDAFKQVTETVVNTVNQNSALSEGLTEIDPTNPDAEFGEETRIFGDVVLNVATEGASGTAFSDGSEFIQDLNDVTDNTFTLNNIEDVISDFDLNF